MGVRADGYILDRGVGAIGAPPEESLADVLNSMGGAPISAYASVVTGPTGVAALSHAVREMFGVPLRIAETGTDFRGLKNGYTRPERLGVDRWLAIIGARTLRQGVLVVDAGTAMTIDGVSRDGRHVGGYIVPGYRLQCAALGRYTAAVSNQELAEPVLDWGRSTEEAVANGVRLGMVALINRARVDLQKLVADTCSVILTGGDAYLLVGAVDHHAVVDEDLLFRGLWATIAPIGCDLRRPSGLG